MKVLAFTGTRAEFGLLTPLVRALEHGGSDLQWVASGMHLLPEYGSTIQLVRQDPAKIAAEIPYFQFPELSQNFGAAVPAIAEVLKKAAPDWLLILGDRHETLSAALAASFVGVPIAHLHGGDKADSGHMDEAQRHAITRFAALHLAASDGSAERLRKFGEEEWRIHMVGAPGIDRLRLLVEESAPEITDWASQHQKPFLLSIFHPVSTEAEIAGQQAEVLFAALDQRPEKKLVIFPNNDPGGAAVLAVIKAREARTDYQLVPNLTALEYAAALSHATLFVGNSSSGVIEAPFFGLPMVHVGRRNLGREHAGQVHYVDFNADQIGATIAQVIAAKEAGKFANMRNPYGDGHAAELAAQVMRDLCGDARLLRKLITY